MKKNMTEEMADVLSVLPASSMEPYIRCCFRIFMNELLQKNAGRCLDNEEDCRALLRWAERRLGK